MENDRRSNKIITKKRTSAIPEGDKFQDILKRNNIDINDIINRPNVINQ